MKYLIPLFLLLASCVQKEVPCETKVDTVFKIPETIATLCPEDVPKDSLVGTVWRYCVDKDNPFDSTDCIDRTILEIRGNYCRYSFVGKSSGRILENSGETWLLTSGKRIK